MESVSGHELEDNSTASILIVEPSRFGLSGKVSKRLDAAATEVQVETALAEVVKTFDRPNKPHRTHVSEGIELGIDWKTKTLITDPEAVQARKRFRGE